MKLITKQIYIVPLHIRKLNQQIVLVHNLRYELILIKEATDSDNCQEIRFSILDCNLNFYTLALNARGGPIF